MGGDLTQFELKVIALAEHTKNNTSHWAQELRKIVEEHKPKPTHIEPLVNVGLDWSKVYDCAVEGMKTAFEQGYIDEDLSHYVYEAVMTTVFGSDFFQKTRHLQS